MDSADDQYIDCENDMYNLTITTILPNELNSNEEFRTFWNIFNIPDYYERSIRIYTDTDFYAELNNKVRSGRKSYKHNFNYKAFHFLLTRGIQIRKVNKCTDVFRRTRDHYITNVLREMRFGQFASSSLTKNPNGFGNASCFKIKTCFGANISNISVFKHEKEVLIPPYEKFKITNIEKNSNEMNCEVLYTLESSGRCSEMNCKLLNRKKKMCCIC